MKTSLRWLQTYFDTPLPAVEELADALTFHVAEIEEAEGDLLDVKVLPDRATYLLSHRGIAKEISAILDIPLSQDPLKDELPTYPSTGRLTVALDDEGKTSRYIGALVTGVKVGPSPDWLKEALTSVGQRSINNVVDATNYVMLNIGQPLHAFDAGKLTSREGTYAIAVRASRTPEKITTLTGETYELPESTLLITDAYADGSPLGIAGIKGGERAKVDEDTIDLVVEAATFDGSSVRKTAQSLKLFTDASSRYQNKPSRALAAYGMRDVLALIQQVAGGEVIDVVDVSALPPEEPTTASVSLSRINAVLGSVFTAEEVRGAFNRLGFSYVETDGVFTVLSPFERRDLIIAEDLIEEVGRIIGYDRIAPCPLPVLDGVPDQARFRGIERIRDFLIERGFIEISTPSFASEGEIELQNPLQLDRPYLRASLIPSLKDSLTRAAMEAPRTFGVDSLIKLFEVGTVFHKTGEVLTLSMGIVATTGKPALAAGALKEYGATLEQELLQKPGVAKYSLDGQMMEIAIGALNLEKLGEDYAPLSVRLGSFRPYSLYPFALRDVAVWTPEGTEESEVLLAIVPAAGEYLARIDLFDRFEKEGRTSYAFRLVFESMDRTLTDADLDPAMSRITEALNAREGFEVR